MKFIKKYHKPLGVVALLIVISIILFSQVKFLTPDQVIDESVGKIISVVDNITNPGGSNDNNSDASSNSPSGPSTDNGDYDRVPITDYIGDNVNRETGSRYVYLHNQSVNYDKEITVYVSVDCLEVLEDDVDCNNSAAWKYVPSDGYIVKKTAVTCYEGENVWDAVARVLNANSLDYAYEGDPPFIHGTESISTSYGSCYFYRCNHLSAGNASKNERGPFGNEYAGWTYKVNGVYPGWGMNGVVIRQGDVIELKYYTGYNPFQMDAEGNF